MAGTSKYGLIQWPSYETFFGGALPKKIRIPIYNDRLFKYKAVQRMGDDEVITEIVALQEAVKAWAMNHELWFDCAFKAYLDHVGGEPPGPPVATLLTFDGPLYSVLASDDPEELEPGFSALIESLGFEYEVRDASSVEIYPIEGERRRAYASYQHWQWICGLIREDFADVHHELFEHFAHRPDDLHRLHWRQYEILLTRVFQNQGFRTELGPGRGDEGVDIRLFQRDPIGDILTIVQAKRYGLRNPVDLDAVAALVGVGKIGGADKALFVTTSRYAPVARRFAARTSGFLTLAASGDVAEWCENASAGIIADKSTLVSPHYVQRLLSDVANKRDPRLVHACCGYNMVNNKFALIIKESRHAALLMSLPARTVSDDGYGQRGTEVPLIDESAMTRLSSTSVWRTARSVKDGHVSYWDGRQLYTPWNGEPCLFDHAD